MNEGFLQELRQSLGPQVSEQLAANLDMEQGQADQAFEKVAPLILGGLKRQAEQGGEDRVNHIVQKYGRANALNDIGGASTDLSAAVAETLATGAGAPAQAIILMTDGLTTRQGAPDDAQITQVLQLLAGGNVPVLVVPQSGQPEHRLANPNDPRFIIGDDQGLSLLSQGDLEDPLVATPIDIAINPQADQRVAYLGALQGDKVQDLFRFPCLVLSWPLCVVYVIVQHHASMIRVPYSLAIPK